MDIKELKKENRELFRVLKDENRKLMNDIEFYLNQFYIKDTEYHLIMNKILKDFHLRLNSSTSVWDSIDDPQSYCDDLLEGYNKKDLSIYRIFINKLPMIVLMFFTLILFYGCTRQFTINAINSSMMEIRGIELLGALMISLIPFFTYFDNQSRMFVRSTVRTSKDLLIFLSGIFAYFLVGKALNEMIVLVLPKSIFIIGFGLSFIWMLVRRFGNYNRA